MPCLGIVRKGRPDVGGPLAHMLTGRSGATHVTCRRGRTNNAGACDKPTIDRLRAGLGVKDPNRCDSADDAGSNANVYSIGHEKENNGIGEPWSEQTLWAGAGCQAALCKVLGWEPRLRIAQHKAITRRKIDSSYDGRWWWGFVASHPILGGTTEKEWDEMATQAEIKALLDPLEARLGAVEAKLGTVERNQSTLERDTRILLDGRTVRVKGEKAQYLIVADGGKLQAVHIENLAQLELAKAAGLVGTGGPWSEVEVDGKAAEALKALIAGND